VVPLLPAYIAFVCGVSLKDLKAQGYRPFIKKILLSSLFYILGFSLIFVLLGTTAASTGIFLRRHDFLIEKIGGILMIIFGLEFAGILKLPLLSKERRLSLPAWAKNLGYLRALVMGIIFAMAWTPCIGAVLGSILALAATAKTAATGAFLLFVYSLGIALPFLIIALTLASAPRFIGSFSRFFGPISKVAGIILAILGLALLTNTFKFLNAWIFDIAFKLGYKIR
jgi:cytochrome c-type biogenesis protein